MAMGLTMAAFLEYVLLFSMAVMPIKCLRAISMAEIRELEAKDCFSCLLVFGDSSVDPGNNNHLATTFKSNFLPYGIDFSGGHPTGRFSNGRLATDFLAEKLGFRTTIPGFLDPNLTKVDLLHAVSFASAGSGYDDLTANFSNSLSMGRQVTYLKHYKIHMRQFIGYKRTEEIIRKAIFIMSMGTNDYLQNYFLEPTRPQEFTLEKYQDFLISRMRRTIEDMHKVGAKRIVVVGVPPLGCMPLVITIAGDGSNCVEKFNKAVLSLNSKIQREVEAVQKDLKMKTTYIDIYGAMERAINNPKKYGFTETSKGCCGTGTVELGEGCKGLETCKDPEKYIFWDAVHPSERMYQIIADEAIDSLSYNFLK